jgi:Flp pilus assembly protein TadG
MRHLHLMPGRRRGARAGRRQRGQALVEFATFVLFVVTLLAGVVDTGGLLNDHTSLEYAAREGARTAAVLGIAAAADCGAIGAIQADAVYLPSVHINDIIIYKAAADGSPADLTNSADAYTGTTTCLSSGATSQGCVSTSDFTTPITCPWPPSGRSNTPFSADSVGVEIDYTYSFEFPFPPFATGAFVASDHAVIPLNPVVIPTP